MIKIQHILSSLFISTPTTPRCFLTERQTKLSSYIFLKDLQEKEEEENGKAPAYEIYQKYSKFYVVPDDNRLPKANLDIWAPWDYLMRLHPGLLTLENYQCDQRLRLYQPGNEDRLDEFLTTNEGRREIFQAFLFILHYSIVLNKYVLQDDQVMDLAVLEPFSPLDLAWLGYSKYECIKSDNPIRIGSTFTKIAWRNLLQTYLLR